MIINNEFTVGADPETVWRHLLDMEGVATCLPGASVTATDTPNTYDGTMRLKIGPMTVEYRGTATLRDVDEHNHTAVIELSAREAKGQGTAMATIGNRLERVGDVTRVKAETDLRITGPQAQFGRGVIEDVGTRVMGEFARRLEQRITAEQDAPASEAAPTHQAASAPERADALDVGEFVPPTVKLAAVALAMLVVAALIGRRWRR
jgi:carbon monoxide dehydrogenase subunit G